MKSYVVGFIFDPSMKNVLLLERKKPPYQHLFNGVGGKIEAGEAPLDAILREVYEETGIRVAENDQIQFLVKLTFPDDIDLYAYSIQLDEVPNEMKMATEEGMLQWLDIQMNNLLDASNPILAGDGNVSYFIHCARLMNKAKR